MNRLVSTVLFALLTVLVACGQAAPPPPKPAAPLVVGKGNEAAPLAAEPAAAPEDDLPIPIGVEDAVRGSRNAYVTLVVFSDFQCPFCGRLVKTLNRLAEAHGPDELRIVFKHHPLPFHDKARPAAEIGQAVLATAGAEAFWRYHDRVFENQRDLDVSTLLGHASDAGANRAEIRMALERKTYAKKVDADIALADRLGANGTPTSFVDGRELAGAQPYEKFEELVAAELEASKSLAERGVARDKLYARLVAANLEDSSARGEREREEEERAAAAAEEKIVWKVPVGNSPVRGSANALVTIVEFSDFQCPFCKRVEPTLQQIRNTYGDKVRFVWKDEPLPFHPRAEPAANLARSARAQKGDAAFWKVHDLLFAAQPQLEDADLEDVARRAGIDAKKAMAAVQAKTFKKQIDDDAALADDVQATGTPHFFVNGRRLVGAQPFDKFKTMIDEEIAKAEVLVKAGTARSSVYATIIKDGKGAPDPERRSIAAPPANAPYRGAANAKVVIQQVGDYQCPFCGRVEGTLEELLKAYPGKIKLVWRDKPLPMHPDAPLAAEAAREAYAQKGNEGWRKMHDLLFANAQALKRGDLESYAVTVGLDATKFKRALDAHTHKPAVDADDKAVSDAGVSGTPSFFIGPFFLSGAQPLAKFKKLVDRALAEPASPPPAAAVTKTTASGLVIKDVVVGTGREAKSGDKVSVHYVGTLTDGTEFDSSRKRGTPFTFDLGKGMVIKGWDQGVVGMRVGGKRTLVIPPDLAYGDKGARGTIPAKATLKFEVELLSVGSP